jgi:acylphosphatase
LIDRRRLVVHGRVQGVFFRESCKREAERLALTGWARNLDDGRVEVVIEGDEAAVDQLVDWCRVGPPRALVTRVEMQVQAPEGLSGFVTR